jgi:hypothetical protein
MNFIDFNDNIVEIDFNTILSDYDIIPNVCNIALEEYEINNIKYEITNSLIKINKLMSEVQIAERALRNICKHVFELKDNKPQCKYCTLTY